MTVQPPAQPAALSAGPAEEPVDTGLGQPIAATADPIDRVVRLAPKWTIFALIASALLIAGAVVWAFGGQITQTVSARGVFVDNGSSVVSATGISRVAKVLVNSGDEVSQGQAVVELTEGDPLVASAAGVVSVIYVAEDSDLLPGEAVMRITNLSVADSVYALLPASMVGSEVADADVLIEVSSAPSSTYGYLEGRVVSVTDMPLTTEQVAQTLGLEPELVATAMGDAPGLLTVIALEVDSAVPSNYAWTVGEGPPFLLTQGTPVTAKVILAQQRPVDILFPVSSDDGSGS